MKDFARIDALPAWWAQHTPTATALIDGGEHWSYERLWSAVQGLASALGALGLQPGQRLLVVGENSSDLVLLLFAACCRDLWPVLVNARLAGPEVAQLVRHSGAAALVFLGEQPAAAAHALAWGAEAWDASGRPGLRLARPAADPAQAAEPVAPDPRERIAALIYTTGTTGTPKGVMLRQRNLLAVARLSAEARGLSASDRAYAVLPVAHVYGLTSVLLATLSVGASLHLAARFQAGEAWRALHDGLTVLQGVPTLFARLLAEDPDPGAAPPAGLRALFSGGAPLDPALKTAVEARFGLPLHNGYGLTENGPSVCQTRLDAPRRDTAVGPPLPGIEIQLLDSTGAQLEGCTSGLLRVRGPGVMAGYYRDPDASAAALADGWLATGDLVQRHADGALSVLGRAGDLIVRSGFKIHPLEVETALQALPGVAQAAVLGRPAAKGEQEVVAFVEWQAGAVGDVEALRAALRARLAPYKIPSRWVVLPALPLSPAGKVRRAELAALAAAG